MWGKVELVIRPDKKRSCFFSSRRVNAMCELGRAKFAESVSSLVHTKVC